MSVAAWTIAAHTEEYRICQRSRRTCRREVNAEFCLRRLETSERTGGATELGRHTRGGLGRAEERLGRRHVAVLAEHRVDQIAVSIDRPIQIAPPAPDL